MKKTTSFIAAIACLAMFSSCQKDNQEVLPDTAKSTDRNVAYSFHDEPCQEVVSEFYAGQNIPVGTVTITNDDANLYVTINTENGWVLGLTHLYAGFTEGLPVNKKGNPKIGNFPFQTTHSPMESTYSYSIPLDEFVIGECILVAVHAEVSLLGPEGEVLQSESAWGGTQPITEGGSWATYINYCLCENPVIGG